MSDEPIKKQPTQDPAEFADTLDTIPEVNPVDPEPKKDTIGELLFQIFCAVIFLGMVGLVFYNAMLRYLVGGSYPPSEEWARFLFIYITFFGSIEAFYRRRHIAVDMMVDLFDGTKRKTLDIIAVVISIVVMVILCWGSIEYVWDARDQDSVATGVNMVWIYGTLPIMAVCSLVILLRDLWVVVRRPSEDFKKTQRS